MESDATKVICCDRYNNDSGWMSAMLNNNNWGNNPWTMMMGVAMMRFLFGNDWQNRMPYDTDIQARFNQIQTQLNDSQNANMLADLVKGNSIRMGELAGALNVDVRAIASGVCDIKAAIQQTAGDVRFTGERVINAAERGDANIVSKLMECCCENKQLVQKMGYENQLSTKEQTYTINERLTGIANGLQKGFSDLGYILAQNKGELLINSDRNTQRILDTLKDHWNWEQSQALQDQKFENSQLRQNIYFRDLVEKGNGCGCGYNA